MNVSSGEPLGPRARKHRVRKDVLVLVSGGSWCSKSPRYQTQRYVRRLHVCTSKPVHEVKAID